MFKKKIILSFIGAFLGMFALIAVSRLITGEGVQLNWKYFLACSVGSLVGAILYMAFSGRFKNR